MSETEYRERSAGAILGGIFFGMVMLRAFGPGASLIGAVVGAAVGWWALKRRLPTNEATNQDDVDRTAR